MPGFKEQVSALRERRIEDLDWENIAEEIEDLGKGEKRSIESHLERLIEHLLKLVYPHGMEPRGFLPASFSTSSIDLFSTSSSCRGVIEIGFSCE
jgi:hypothetical protein